MRYGILKIVRIELSIMIIVIIKLLLSGQKTHLQTLRLSRFAGVLYQYGYYTSLGTTVKIFVPATYNAQFNSWNMKIQSSS